MRWVIVVLLVLAGVPQWSGLDRLPLLGRHVAVHARGWRPAGGWPARIGALEPIGAVTLGADDPAFGGFSALSLAHGRALLLSDGGNYVSVRMRGRQLTTLASGTLPDGPGTGWLKEDRDTESLAEDPRTGALWVGYERANAIWRYTGGFARAAGHVAPAGMRRWRANGGAESLARLPDGRYVVIQEEAPGKRTRAALLFDGDPTARGTRVQAFRYTPPAGFNPSDAAALPNGDLLVLNRRWRPPLRFDARLVRVPAAELRAGHVARGRQIAALDGVVRENCEGLAIAREGGRTIVWIATDNDTYWWRPSLLMKFRLAE